MKSKSIVEFGTFPRSILSEQIADKILSMIKENQLKPGDILPPERELAAMMGVSRPSLREALRALSIMRIIENRQGSGTYVASLEPERLIEHLDVVVSLNDSTFLELFKARKILEVGLAGMAAELISDEDILEIQEIHNLSTGAVGNPELFMEYDMRLHNKILEITRNPILSIFMKSITKLSIMSRRRTNEYPEIRNQTLDDHQQIILALANRNPEAAGESMMKHLNNVEKILMEINNES
jgi:GntR family transcriptional repressor for pyruvate dehydrogenase complex